MTKFNNANILRNLMSLCLMFAVFAATSVISFAAPEQKAQMGEITVSGQNADGNGAFVLLNGERAFSGRTFISSGTIVTEDSSATVRLGKLGYVSVMPHSVLSLNFDADSISANLSDGNVKVINNKGVAVNIKTADGVVTNNTDKNSIFEVNVNSGTTQATAETGSVFLNNVPVQDDDDDDDDNGVSAAAPLIVLGGIVAATVIYLVVNNDDDDDDGFVSPIR